MFDTSLHSFRHSTRASVSLGQNRALIHIHYSLVAYVIFGASLAEHNWQLGWGERDDWSTTYVQVLYGKEWTCASLNVAPYYSERSALLRDSCRQRPYRRGCDAVTTACCSFVPDVPGVHAAPI